MSVECRGCIEEGFQDGALLCSTCNLNPTHKNNYQQAIIKWQGIAITELSIDSLQDAVRWCAKTLKLHELNAEKKS